MKMETRNAIGEISRFTNNFIIRSMINEAKWREKHDGKQNRVIKEALIFLIDCN